MDYSERATVGAEVLEAVIVDATQARREAQEADEREAAALARVKALFGGELPGGTVNLLIAAARSAGYWRGRRAEAERVQENVLYGA